MNNLIKFWVHLIFLYLCFFYHHLKIIHHENFLRHLSIFFMWKFCAVVETLIAWVFHLNSSKLSSPSQMITDIFLQLISKCDILWCRLSKYLIFYYLLLKHAIIFYQQDSPSLSEKLPKCTFFDQIFI